MKDKRDSWSGQLGFVIAAAASAVGLGNLWRFPSSAATYGGGIFLLAYVLLFISFGAFLLMTEIGLGRLTKLSAIEAYRHLSKKWVFVGWLGTLIPFIILPYYSVIGGWVTRYLVQYLMVGSVPDGFFESFTGNPVQSISYMLVFGVATFVFIYLGVQKGVERSNTVMMPALLFLTIGIAVFVCMQPNMGAGMKYYLWPDFSKLCIDGHLSAALIGKTILAAMGQMFFSLSIAMGIMITYGSYVPDKTNLPKSTLQIGICDSFVAFVAGLIVIPAAFAFGGEELAKSAGPGLMFISLPKVLAAMPFARYVAILFFVLVLFAALTSCMSIAETCVASLTDRTGWSRYKSSTVTMVYCLLGAVPSAMSLGFLDKSDYITNNVLMPICAFFTCIFVGWIVGPEVLWKEFTKDGRDRFVGYRYYSFLIKYIAPVLIGIIFISII